MFIDKKKALEATSVKSLNMPSEIIGHSDEVHENEAETLTQSEWLCKNIPFIETPDTLLDKVYYYRWKNLLSCLAKRREDGKYELCESAPGSYYHKYIDCAQGAHLREARWIRDTKYLNDYVDVTPSSVNYWNYFIDSVYQKYLLDGDIDLLRRNYQKLCDRFNAHSKKFDADMGLYYTKNDLEGQEAGVNGFEKLEREMTYTASFTSSDTSLKALTDNCISGEYWSCKGSGNRVDSIEISLAVEGFCPTDLRIWFKDEPLNVSVFYSDGEKWLPVSDLKRCDGEMTLLSFEKIRTDKLRLELENDLDNGRYASIYELVVVYRLEPWGCDSFWTVIGGDESYRINANSFMSAAAYSLGKISRLLGVEDTFTEQGDRLKEAIVSRLWDDGISYFREITRDEKRVIVGKESNAYSTWSFCLMPDSEKYARAWEYTRNDFSAPFGLTSLERKSPHYMQEFTHGCLWNGPVWPYTFSMILCGMANLLHLYREHNVTREEYFDLLKRYCLCHFDNFSEDDFAVREDHHPENNHWLAQAREYNHSTFIDNVLNGLFGIRPEEDALVIDPIIPDNWDFFCVEDVKWRGKDITVVYDKTGERYGKGSGLSVFVDGQRTAYSPSLQCLEIQLSEIFAN